MIHWQLLKKFKFDHGNKWYMHNTESVLDNETHKALWYFEIQKDNRSLHSSHTTRPSDSQQQKKKKKKKEKKKREPAE